MTNQATIDDLAARIVAEHKAVRATMKSTLEHALACGDLLIEAKAKLAHGTWRPWLAEHCALLSERTAQVYISLAKNRTAIRAAIEAKSADAADLTMTIRDALELIARQAEPPFQSPRYPVSHQVNIVASNRSMPSSVKLQLSRLRTPSTEQAKHKASGECSYPRVTYPPAAPIRTTRVADVIAKKIEDARALALDELDRCVEALARAEEHLAVLGLDKSIAKIAEGLNDVRSEVEDYDPGERRLH